MSSIYHNMINLVFSIEIRGSPSRLVDIALLESGARDINVLCGSGGYQSEAIGACFPVQTVFLDCWAKNALSRFFYFVVKDILGCVILIVRRRMSKYKSCEWT